MLATEISKANLKFKKIPINLKKNSVKQLQP